ncbi:MAG: hypothetical protein WB992_19920, partial [Bryobacteraceae bacterium]
PVLFLIGCGGVSKSGQSTPPASYSISGTVTGLAAGSGGIVLEDDGADNLAVKANGAFRFSTSVTSGGMYDVTVLTQPSNPVEQCTVANGQGKATANVTNVEVQCAVSTPPAQYTISGTLTGLAVGSGGLILQDNNADSLSLKANGTFHFSAAVTSGGSYNVAVLTQPSLPIQQCTVVNGTGTATANVSNVGVQCAAPIQYTISGTLVDLAASSSGLVLQNNAGDNLLVNANGGFQFAATISGGEPYNVTVLSQPSSPIQQCTVANGSGTATTNVTNVKVECGHNEWVWMSGSPSVNQISDGTLGIPAPGDTPGGRQWAATWTDASGNLWLFGGYGPDSTGTLLPMNDLWKFSAGEWTWMAGPPFGGQIGNYGTLGVPSPTSIPGARFEAAAWTDASGNFWLFGGIGFDSAGHEADLNDLWKYSGGEWTWMGGSDLATQHGVYGTLGIPSSNNIPGSRDSAAAWVDSNGDVWLLGGDGYDASSAIVGMLNDLWKYSAGEWTWIGGSDIMNQKGVYGTKGIASGSNVPGARFGAYHWIDASGNLWLFGGCAYDSTGTSGQINDLWRYSGGQWTWMGGDMVVDQMGVYGAKGTASASNLPGAREFGVAWGDGSGNGWIFGGNARDSIGAYGEMNDLWKYSGGQWTWVAGSNVANPSSSYGTEGTLAPGDAPGGRFDPSAWKDANGNLWVLGGWQLQPTPGNLNDLWMYMP